MTLCKCIFCVVSNDMAILNDDLEKMDERVVAYFTLEFQYLPGGPE